jgi:hypothetical protein
MQQVIPIQLEYQSEIQEYQLMNYKEKKPINHHPKPKN